jgi:hypothetical protein
MKTLFLSASLFPGLASRLRLSPPAMKRSQSQRAFGQKFSAFHLLIGSLSQKSFG